MAISQSHFRSVSLPSRLHPINTTGFEAELQKLKSSQASNTIQSNLLGLAELYSSIDELTHSPSTRSIIDESLEGSVELLDSCGRIKELVEMMRESVRALQSALRRKGLDAGIQNDVGSYICCRKRMSKCIKRTLKTLKSFESKINASNLSPEVFGLTVAIFKCVLLFFSTSAVKFGGWNLVSRLMINKSVDQNVVTTEVGCVDFALSNLQGSIRNGDCKSVDMQMVQRSLQNLDSCVEGIEGGLEAMFRRLLQTRVHLLNIVTNH